ncbi:MAG: DUF4097 domain-containing protein [Oscillospiraceae bacterium]|nr:DUF4097 domain-containing protein [Oscillospiraceae bacterium]
MKKTLTVISIIAVAAVAAGTLMLLASWSLGTAGAVSLGRDGLRVTHSDVVSTLSMREIEGVTSLKVDAVSADVTCIPAQDFGFEIRTYAGEPAWRLEDGVLLVDELRHDTGIFNFSLPWRDTDDAGTYIKIYYPQGSALDVLSITNVSGDIKFPGLDGAVREAVFATSDGDIDVSSLKADALTLRTVSGHIQTRGARAARTTLDTSSGEVALADFSGALDAQTVSGDIEISAADIAFQITSASGDVDVAAETLSGRISAVSGNVGVAAAPREGDLSYSVRTVSGAIVADGRRFSRFAQSAQGGPYDLDIDTTSGNVLLTCEATPG